MQGLPAAAQASTRHGLADPRSSYGKVLYIGNLASSVSQETLQEIFSTLGPVGEINIITDRSKGLSAGYGFVQYLDLRTAEMALHLLDGRVLHGQELRVHSAYQKVQRGHSSLQCQIFVGGLASDVNDKMLLDAFFPYGCTNVRVILNHDTGLSKGYGFVAFRCRADAEQALAQMSGVLLGSRRIRCLRVQHKQETSSASYAAVDRADPENASVYIGNLAADVTDVVLWQHVAQFGAVTDFSSHRKRGYAFAHYATHADAVRAIVALTGQSLGGKALKCSWSRHQAQKAGTYSVQAGLAGYYSALTLQQQAAAAAAAGRATARLHRRIRGEVNSVGHSVGGPLPVAAGSTAAAAGCAAIYEQSGGLVSFCRPAGPEHPSAAAAAAGPQPCLQRAWRPVLPVIWERPSS